MVFNRNQNNFNLIRLLAATQVLVVHTFNHFNVDNVVIRGLKLFPGVPIFFFISGFLIGGTFIHNRHKGLYNFFRNRFLRLYPALWACFMFSIFIVSASGYFVEKSLDGKQFFYWILGQISFLQFYNPDFLRDFGVGVLNGSLWTIAVELQFYILTPVIFFLAWFRKGLLIIPLIVVSITANVYLRVNPNWDLLAIKLLTVSFLPWIYIFVLGFLFAYYDRIREMAFNVNLWFVFLIFLASMFGVGNYVVNSMNSINPVSVLALAILVFRLAYVDLKLPDNVVSWLKENDFSYGIYIYHMPFINYFLYKDFQLGYMNMIIVVVLVFVTSALSWKFIEKPALSIKH